MSLTASLRLWKLSSVFLAIGFMVMVVALFATRAYAVPQPNMEAALGHLQEAKASLERAEHNKGGFRVKAIGAVNQAIAVVREGIAVGNK